MRHGKRLFLKITENLYLTLHLGLTGMLIYLESGDDEPHHTRLLISFENGCSLAFDDPRIFGEVGLAKSPQAFLAERKVGPDALQIDLDGFLILFSFIQEVLKTALATHADLEKLPDSYLLPHRHPGGRCPRDGANLSREKIGGRTSYYCPEHQKMTKS